MIRNYIVAWEDEGLHRGGVLGVPHFSPKYQPSPAASPSETKVILASNE